MAHDFDLALLLGEVEGADEGHPDFQDALRPVLQQAMDVVSRFGPVDGVEGFTFALDYNAALEDLSRDRGFGSKPLMRTNEDYAQGYAMAVIVKRGEVFKTRIVFSATVLIGLLGSDQAKNQWAAGALLHELGHAVEHAMLENALPGTIGSPLPDRYEATFYQYVELAFGEYFACRVSAAADPKLAEDFRGAFLESLDRLKTDIPAALWEYRHDHDMPRFADLAFRRVGDALKYAGYWCGLVDGLGEEPDIASVGAELEQARFDEALPEILAVFRHLWERRGTWENISEFFAVHRVMEHVLQRYGLWPEPHETGMWIDVPLTF